MISQCSTGGFGSPTDWLSAIAAIISAVGLFVVAAKTNRLADKTNDLSQANVALAASANDIATSANVIGKSANHIAESVVEIERARDKDSSETRSAEQVMLLLSIAGQMGQTSADLADILQAIDAMETDASDEDKDLPRATAQRVLAAQYTLPESVRSRIHFLDQPTYARVLRTEGLFAMLRARYALFGVEQLAVELPRLKDGLTRMKSDIDFVYKRCVATVQATGIDG